MFPIYEPELSEKLNHVMDAVLKKAIAPAISRKIFSRLLFLLSWYANVGYR